jgi:predicted dehydrogenase
MTGPRPAVAIVGLGFGRAHIPAFQANGCDVVAVCQRDEATARRVADRYGVPHVFARWDEMLERARPDIVVIATPPHLHAAIAARAFDLGAHVLCEKPLAMTRAEADAMAEAAARAKRIAMTGFNWRFTRAFQELRDRITQGAVGRVFHVSGRWLGGRWADAAAPSTWRMDRAQAGHGAMGDMGVHMIDMIRCVVGDFARVAAHAGMGYPSRTVPGSTKVADAEDYCAVLGELTSGAQVAFSVSRVARGANEHTLDVWGSAGALSYRLARDLPAWWDGELRMAVQGSFERVDLGAPSPAPGADPMDAIGTTMIAPLVARMLDGIARGETPSPSFEDGARAQAVLDAVAASIARRVWIDV